MNARAFDAIARNYDEAFTHTEIGQALREIVWRKMEKVFSPGSRILELNCGTGEDAVWLARRGVRVLATDVSPAMLQVAEQKATGNAVHDKIEFARLDLATPAGDWPDREFDGAFSNFGGFNCVPDLTPLASLLSRSLKPGGPLIVVLMGRACAWEMLWYALHLQPRSAFRRLARAGWESCIGSEMIRVWYPSTSLLKRILAPEFALQHRMGVGTFLPPSYLYRAVSNRPALSRLLQGLEGIPAATALLGRFSDHILYHFERSNQASRR